jgi:hypothetical protein
MSKSFFLVEDEESEDHTNVQESTSFKSGPYHVAGT